MLIFSSTETMLMKAYLRGRSSETQLGHGQHKQRVEEYNTDHPGYKLRVIFHFYEVGDITLENQQQQAEQNSGNEQGNGQRIVQFLPVVRLGKTKITGLQAVGKQNVQEGYHGVDLCIGIGAIRIEKSETQQADTEIEETAHDTRNPVPDRLPR